MKELRKAIRHTIGEWEEPADGDVYALSHFWYEYAGAVYEELADKYGWKVDWVRAAKLVWLEHLVRGTWLKDGEKLQKSTHLPASVYALTVSWLQGFSMDSIDGTANEVLSRKRIEQLDLFLFLNKQEIWERADELRIAHNRQYYRRVPLMSMAEEE